VPATNQNARSILVLTSSYPRFDGDTSSVFLHYLYRQIHRHGYDVHIIAPDDRDARPASTDGIHIHRFRYFPKRIQNLAYGSGIVHNLRSHPLRWIQVPFFVLSMSVTFFWLLVKLKPVVVHSHWLIPMGVISGLLKPFFSYENIVTSHGSDVYSLNGVVASRLKLFALDRADTWTVNSNASAQHMIEKNHDLRPRVIPMGVDFALFSSGNGLRVRKLHSAGDKFVILFVGRLVSQKGIQDLISAFSLLPAEILSNCLLWVVGEGMLAKQLEEQVSTANLTDQIQFLGAVSHKNLADYYAAADLFVGPSRVEQTGDTESQGVVYLEAFASGTPVIASNVGGIPDIVEHNVNGVLVEPANPADLSSAIVTIYSDSMLRSRLSAQARSVASSKYDWESIANQFTSLFDVSTKKIR
jgi:teichuronic acid biosynthesis glycosyltransferase TuaC